MELVPSETLWFYYNILQNEEYSKDNHASLIYYNKEQRIHAKPKVIAAEALGSQNWMCFGLQIVNIGLAPLPT